MAYGDARPKLIEAGRTLMLAQGYSATSIDEVCSAAGVSKGSFYHLFGSKEDFGLVVLDDFHKRGVGRIQAGDFVTATDPQQRLRSFLDHMESIAPDLWRHGCLLGTFAAELGESSPAIHAHVAELFEKLTAQLAPLFVSVVEDADEGMALASEMLAVLEGWIVMARAYDDPQRIAEGVRRWRRGLEGRVPGLQPAGAAGR